MTPPPTSTRSRWAPDRAIFKERGHTVAPYRLRRHLCVGYPCRRPAHAEGWHVPIQNMRPLGSDLIGLVPDTARVSVLRLPHELLPGREVLRVLAGRIAHQLIEGFPVLHGHDVSAGPPRGNPEQTKLRVSIEFAEHPRHRA